MRFDDRFLEALKSRLRLSDVIGRSVKLRRQGREFAGLSPFAKEKTPSFFVNDDKGFYHCFSSGKHGDLISFLQETERLTFPEAVERLAAEAGLAIPAEDPRAAEQAAKRQGLADWLELAARWFEAELRRPTGAAARDYLEGRGLDEGEWSRFRLGYAPAERTRLKDYLIAKGATAPDLVAAGMLVAPEDGGAPYDRFRDRIIFPIGDARGRVISFGGRALNPETRAKYLNGSDTALFNKGRTLYGLHEARRLLHTGGEAAQLVVVEGYMDVIACQRADVAAVASQGTALTEDQMTMLWRLHPEPTLCFDGDEAGRRAAHRALDRALPLLQPGRSFRFAALSGGKDADDVARQQGADALKAQLARAAPFVAVLFDRERALQPLDTPERRTALKGRLLAAAGAIQNRDLAQAYREDLLRRLSGLYARPEASPRAQSGGRRDYHRPAAPQPASEDARAAARQLAGALPPFAAAVAQGLLDDPARIDDHLEQLEAAGLGHPALMRLAKACARLRLEADELASDTLRRHLAAQGFAPTLAEVDRAARTSRAAFLEPDLPPAEARRLWTLAYGALIGLEALERAMATAKADMASIGVPAFLRLKSERDALRRTIMSGEAA